MVEKMKNIIPNGGLMVFVCSHLPPKYRLPKLARHISSTEAPSVNFLSKTSTKTCGKSKEAESL